MSAATMITTARVKAQPQGNGLLKYRFLLILASQAWLLVLAYYISFMLRLDANLDTPARALFWHTLPLVLVIKVALSYRFGLMHGWWRYVGMSDLLDISRMSFVGSMCLYVLVE